jgi:hypothetical protein
MVRLNEFSRKHKLISIMIAIILVLLFFANAVAFKLFTLPSFEANVASYVILAAAVALTIQVLAIVFIERRRAVVLQERNLHGTVVENSSGASVTQPEKQLSTEPLTQSSSQKASQQQNNIELIKQAREKVKLVCPACRKEFSSTILTEDFMVDYGPSKSSNIIRHCPYCLQPIELKRKNN